MVVWKQFVLSETKSGAEGKILETLYQGEQLSRSFRTRLYKDTVLWGQATSAPLREKLENNTAIYLNGCQSYYSVGPASNLTAHSLNHLLTLMVYYCGVMLS